MSNSPNKQQLAAELKSPSKRMKQIFRNRHSNLSIESISEAGEYATEQEHEQEYGSAYSISPTKSPKSNASIISSFIKPRHSRPSLSLEVRSSTERLHIPPKKEPVKVEDFADSSEGSQDYDSDSVNSILQEYEVQPSQTTKKEFVFQENFDESGEAPSQSNTNPGNATSTTVYHDCTETLPGVRSPVKGTTSSRRQVISSSSNIDENSILMLSDMPQEHSEDALYPEPEIAINDTPVKMQDGQAANDPIEDTHEIKIQQPVLAELTDNSNRTRNSAYTQSSLSSGELLTRLEASYDRSGRNRRPVSGLNNFTARLDSRTELPVMLYKVENESFDEKRWSVVESKRDSARERKKHQGEERTNNDSHGSNDSNESTRLYPGQKISIHTDHSETSSSGPDRGSEKQRRSQSTGLSGSNGSHSGSGSMSGSRSAGHSSIQSYFDRLKQTKDDKQSPGPNTNDPFHDENEILPGTPHQDKSPKYQFDIPKPSPNEKLHDIEARKTSHERMFYEKEDNYHPPTSQRYHTWFLFSFVMVLALVVPPVYYMITLGVMDGGRSRYGSQPKYSRGQKIVSLVIGLLWTVVILAMIGVGFGLGIGREN